MSIHNDTDPVDAPAAQAGSRHARGGASRLLLVLAMGVLLSLLVRLFVLQSFYVPSPGMAPNVTSGSRVLVWKPFVTPEVGDVVVADVTDAFGGPQRATHEDDGLIGRTLSSMAGTLGVRNGSTSVLSRVVAVGGQKVQVQGGSVLVDGRQVATGLSAPDEPEFTVPEGHVWLLGDNPRLSTDSLTYAASTPSHGSVRASDVVGSAWLTFWPLNQFGAIGSSTDSASTDKGASR